jgi:dipeptidyl aminopeptidase/acylaminoacyl peptidase
MPQGEETLDPAYQPTDGTVLKRFRFTPPGYQDGHTYPTVLMIPPAEFKGADDHGVPSEKQATADLQAAGFLVFQIEHRLATPGQISGQPAHTWPFETSGLPAQQQGDVERQILAALNDSHCNQSIYLVGGSSGGCHALWVALNATASDSSGWTEQARQHIKAVVSLSGCTDLNDFTDYDQGVDIQKYEDVCVNYTNTEEYPPDPAARAAIRETNSPITIVQGANSGVALI